MRLKALGTLCQVKIHLLTFRQCAEAIHLDGGVVAKHVFASSVLNDETKALRVVEPFHSACCHCDALSCVPVS